MTFYTAEKKILSLLTMIDVVELLPPDRFVRIHKSYIVSLNQIDIVDKHEVIEREIHSDWNYLSSTVSAEE